MVSLFLFDVYKPVGYNVKMKYLKYTLFGLVKFLFAAVVATLFFGTLFFVPFGPWWLALQFNNPMFYLGYVPHVLVGLYYAGKDGLA